MDTNLLTALKVQEKALIDPKENQSNNLRIGDFLEGQGVYLGNWEPKDKNGFSLKETFALYAAQKDLEIPNMNFNELVTYTAKLKDYFGYNGGNFANEDAIIEAVINNPELLESWFIPPKDVLNIIYNNHKVGALNGTLHMLATYLDEKYYNYYSSTETPEDHNMVYLTNLTGKLIKIPKNNYDSHFTARLVRAVRL